MAFSNKMLKISVGLGLAALMIPASARTGDKKVEDLLAKMRAAYAAVKTASYSTESHQGGIGFVSKFTYTAPLDVKSVIVSTTAAAFKPGVTISTDGKLIHISSPTMPAEIKEQFKMDLFEKNLVGNLESLCFFDWKRQLSTAKGMNMENSTFRILNGVTWRGRKWTVLEESVAKDKVVCSYYLDPTTNLIWRTEYKVLAGGNKASQSDSWLIELNGKSLFKNVKVDDVIHV